MIGKGCAADWYGVVSGKGDIKTVVLALKPKRERHTSRFSNKMIVGREAKLGRERMGRQSVPYALCL